MSKKDEIKIVEASPEMFNMMADAGVFDFELPYTCDVCGCDVDEDNYGYVSADFKTCNNIDCRWEAINNSEKDVTFPEYAEADGDGGG